jgi:hypothetical protein
MNCKNYKTAIDTASSRAPYGVEVKSHLSGCPDCRNYADETNSLLALLKQQPRVQVPPDFEFRLRARMAREQSEKRNPLGFLEVLWARTFSWGQAATALAAIALTTTFSFYYFNNATQPSTTSGDIAAVATNDTAAPKSPVEPGINEERSETRVDVVQPAKPAYTRVASRTSGKPAAEVLQPVVMQASSAPASIAFNDNSTRLYNAEKRQVLSTTNRNTVIGVEDAGLAKSATVAYTF